MAEAGRLYGFSHLPGPGPASSKTRGPLVHIAGRSKACPSCQPAYGPLIMLDPRSGRPPAKPAPPTSDLALQQWLVSWPHSPPRPMTRQRGLQKRISPAPLTVAEIWQLLDALLPHPRAGHDPINPRNERLPATQLW